MKQQKYYLYTNSDGSLPTFESVRKERRNNNIFWICLLILWGILIFGGCSTYPDNRYDNLYYNRPLWGGPGLDPWDYYNIPSFHIKRY